MCSCLLILQIRKTNCKNMKSPKIMKNPWLNISLSDTVANCDKSVINSLTTAVKSKIVLDTLPEPYHGDPEAKVYLLNGNPGHSEKDLTFVGCGNAIQAASVLPNGKNAFSNIYEKEICEELWHVNKEFIWLRDPETVVNAIDESHLGYKWWKDRVRKLKKACGCEISEKVFCIECFPYHTKHKMAFDLPSGKYVDDFIYSAMEEEKVIVLMRSRREWFARIKGLENYSNLILLNSCQNVSLSPGNMTKSDWEKLVKSL